MPLVSITRLRVRSWRHLPGFFLRAFRSGNQAKSAPGNLAVTILREVKRTFWTLTVWTSEQDMKAYMTAGAHGKAMRRLLEWCDEAALAHWTQESAEPPSWEEAHRRLQQSGRPSKVNHPSEDQRAFRVPPPVVTKTGEARLK
jgi:heme-degrading monooxygenase HmoA